VNILKWIHKNGNRKTPPAVVSARHFTALGNAIDPEWRSGWSPDESGRYEMRRHVGQSAEGFHAGVEVSCRIYSRIVWGEAYPTPERALEGADEMESRRREEIEGCPEIEQAVARGRAFGKEH
jgi:hypothetical protein